MWASATSLSTVKEMAKTVAGGKRIDDPAVFICLNDATN
jgi:hypothetical protein